MVRAADVEDFQVACATVVDAGQDAVEGGAARAAEWVRAAPRLLARAG